VQQNRSLESRSMEIRGSKLVLVFDQDVIQARKTAAFLMTSGLLAEACADSGALFFRLAQVSPDLLLLHWPGEVPHPMIEMLRQVRAATAVPCILRAHKPSNERDRIIALESGADDCIPQDFTEQEVVARIRAVMRRVEGAATGSYYKATPNPAHRRTTSQPRAWRLSLDRRELYSSSGTPCELTTAEFDFLHALTQSRGSPVSREALTQAVFRRPWYPHDRGIDNLAVRLRRKLAYHCPTPDVIKAVRGVGYVFTGF
jgi:two-component system phosphate regulon response regulator OmpR